MLLEMRLERVLHAAMLLVLAFLILAAKPVFIVAVAAKPVTASPHQALKLHATFAEPLMLRPFQLTDTRGRPFSNSSIKGRWTMVVLGFTNCPDICPTTLQHLNLVRDELAKTLPLAELPEIMFIAVDPDRDAAILKDYVKSFGEGVIGATGDWENVKKAIIAFRGRVQIIGKTPTAQTYEVRHSASISLINPQGRVASRINPRMGTKEMAALIHSRWQAPAESAATAQSRFLPK